MSFLAIGIPIALNVVAAGSLLSRNLRMGGFNCFRVVPDDRAFQCEPRQRAGHGEALVLSRTHTVKLNRQQEHHDGEHDGVADDPDVAKTHVAEDHSAESCEGQASAHDQ